MKTWSATQDPLALSSCEAEYYVMAEGVMKAAAETLGIVVEGATRAIGMQSAAKELGIEAADIVIEVATDSSAAKSFASRRGSGGMRHVEVKWLWLQQAVADGKVRLQKILGATNPADVCTKYQALKEIEQKLKAVNIFVEGRSTTAEDASEGLAARSAWAVLQRGGPRVTWADAEDSDGDDAGDYEECGFGSERGRNIGGG